MAMAPRVSIALFVVCTLGFFLAHAGRDSEQDKDDLQVDRGTKESKAMPTMIRAHDVDQVADRAASSTDQSQQAAKAKLLAMNQQFNSLLAEWENVQHSVQDGLAKVKAQMAEERAKQKKQEAKADVRTDEVGTANSTSAASLVSKDTTISSAQDASAPSLQDATSSSLQNSNASTMMPQQAASAMVQSRAATDDAAQAWQQEAAAAWTAVRAMKDTELLKDIERITALQGTREDMLELKSAVQESRGAAALTAAKLELELQAERDARRKAEEDAADSKLKARLLELKAMSDLAQHDLQATQESRAALDPSIDRPRLAIDQQDEYLQAQQTLAEELAAVNRMSWDVSRPTNGSRPTAASMQDRVLPVNTRETLANSKFS